MQQWNKRAGWMLAATAGLGLSAVLALSSGATAAPYGTAGCGLGSLVFHDEPGFMQVFAATLNSTGVQTFGITTGTSNCAAKSKRAASAEQVNDFIVANRSTLQIETARGQGETVATLANLLGCDQGDDTLRSFGAMTQAKHAELMAQPDAPAMQQVIVSGVRARPDLNQRCAVAS